jgi:Cupin domain
MEATYGGDAPPPPEHLHPRQDEHFDVLEGRVRTVIGGTERVYEVGESFDVPARTPHQLEALGPARLRWEVRPAQRTAEFFERLYGGGAAEGFLEEFSEEIRFT